MLVEHLEELAYLSIQRRKLLFSPEVPLRRLKLHDGRIEAHLDGLRTGGAASVAIAAQKLAGDPWLVSAAARAWLEQGQPGPDAVIDQLKTVEPEWAAGWKEAFRAIAPELVQRLLPQGHPDRLPPLAQQVAADAWGWHGLLRPETAGALRTHPKSSLRFTLARHLAWNGLGPDTLLEDPDVLVRRAALWGLALRNPKAAMDQSRQAARATPPDPFALRVLGLLGERADGRLLVAALAPSGARLAALHALRDLAQPEFADALVEFLESDDEETALAARAAVESLVGRLPSPDLEKAAPPGISLARFQWQQVRPKLDLASRRLQGQPFPWTGDPADEPMERLWRQACVAAKPESTWLRREVPDGFFTGLPSLSAIPGE